MVFRRNGAGRGACRKSGAGETARRPRQTPYSSERRTGGKTTARRLPMQLQAASAPQAAERGPGRLPYCNRRERRHERQLAMGTDSMPCADRQKHGERVTQNRPRREKRSQTTAGPVRRPSGGVRPVLVSSQKVYHAAGGKVPCRAIHGCCSYAKSGSADNPTRCRCSARTCVGTCFRKKLMASKAMPMSSSAPSTGM